MERLLKLPFRMTQTDDQVVKDKFIGVCYKDTDGTWHAYDFVDYDVYYYWDGEIGFLKPKKKPRQS